MTHSDKAAERGEPGYVWRSGQDRRLDMIRRWSDLNGRILDNGTGLGTYLEAIGRISPDSLRIGLEIEHERAVAALARAGRGRSCCRRRPGKGSKCPSSWPVPQ